GFEAVAVRLPHEREEMVGAPDRLEPEPLDETRDVTPSVPVQSLLSLEHHPQLHACTSVDPLPDRPSALYGEARLYWRGFAVIPRGDARVLLNVVVVAQLDIVTPDE